MGSPSRKPCKSQIVVTETAKGVSNDQQRATSFNNSHGCDIHQESACYSLTNKGSKRGFCSDAREEPFFLSLKNILRLDTGKNIVFSHSSILCYLAFHNMLFQSNGKKIVSVYFIALYLFAYISIRMHILKYI